MQVSFCGILKAIIPNENTVHAPIKNRFSKMKNVEDVLNCKESDVYNKNESMKLRLFAQRTVRDYKTTNPYASEEENKQAGLLRLTTREGIFYCTGVDIELAKKKQQEIKDKGLVGKEKDEELKNFIKERQQESSSGFISVDSTDGERLNIFIMGSGKDEKSLNCDVMYL